MHYATGVLNSSGKKERVHHTYSPICGEASESAPHTHTVHLWGERKKKNLACSARSPWTLCTL